MANWPAYNLTTISQPVDEMIDTAIKLIIDKEDGIPIGQRRLLPGKLIVRGSTRKD